MFFCCFKIVVTTIKNSTPSKKIITFFTNPVVPIGPALAPTSNKKPLVGSHCRDGDVDDARRRAHTRPHHRALVDVCVATCLRTVTAVPTPWICVTGNPERRRFTLRTRASRRTCDGRRSTRPASYARHTVCGSAGVATAAVHDLSQTLIALDHYPIKYNMVWVTNSSHHPLYRYKPSVCTLVVNTGESILGVFSNH